MVATLAAFLSFILYVLFGGGGIYAGDSGDLVTAAFEGGVPHPPGYPLYTALVWLATRLPFAPTWSATLLSSIPHALVVGVVYWLVFRLTKRHSAAFFSAVFLGGNYLFFLYSVTPEVFALFDAFVLGIILLTYLLQVVPTTATALWLFFLFGLSLSHHHVVLFLVPAIVYAIRIPVGRLFRSPLYVFRASAVFLAGLTPYLYVVIASRGPAIVNWDKPTSLERFIMLITRQDYGTFVSSGAAAFEWYPRLLNVRAYFEFVLLDFRWVGIMLVVLGIWKLWAIKRRFAVTVLLAILGVGPLFFFYASFPLQGAFALGTYERFLLPSYGILAVIAGVGFSAIDGALKHLTLSPSLIRVARRAVIAMLCLYPVLLGGMTLWRFWGLPSDKTAEHLATDILVSAPQRAIVLLVHDTALFTTQYVRYALNVRPDTAVLHFARIHRPEYREIIGARFPDVIIPPPDEHFFSEFVRTNIPNRPVVSNIEFPLTGGYTWVPHGLLFLAQKDDERTSQAEVIRINDALWAGYHDPKAGILARYRHLMLSHVLDEYAAGRLAYGKYLFRADSIDAARDQFERALQLNADSYRSDIWTYLGMTQVLLSRCDDALASFGAARESGAPDPRLYYYEAVTYRECLKDERKAAERLKLYESQRREAEQPLEAL